jgi:hypothetical protein
VGTARTGTKSLAHTFRRSYRAAHEPESLALIEVLLRVDNGGVSYAELLSYVKKRDRSLWLEVESSQLAAELLSFIVPTYPQAKFILTIRDPISWLESIVNHELREAPNRTWTRWANRELQQHLEHPGEESEFAKRGLFTVEGYLSKWTRHNQHVLDSVPVERLLIVRTEDISSSLGRIADFLEIPVHTLDASSSHANIGADKISVLTLLERDYLEKKVAEICGQLMRTIPIDVQR